MGTKEKIRNLIKDWEQKCYIGGLPDEAPIELEKNNLVISYRKICIAIMKNDISLKTLGFEKNKSLIYNELKIIELNNLGKIKQLKLNL